MPIFTNEDDSLDLLFLLSLSNAVMAVFELMSIHTKFCISYRYFVGKWQLSILVVIKANFMF